MTTGERIRNLRKELKLTQEDVGKALGIQKAAVNKYEKDTVKNIKRENIIKRTLSPPRQQNQACQAAKNHTGVSARLGTAR